MKPDTDSTFRPAYKKPYAMLEGRTPTPEDIAQGALEEGTSGDAQVLLAAVLLTPAGEMRLVSMQEYMTTDAAPRRMCLIRTGPPTATRGARVEIDGNAVPYALTDANAFTSASAVFGMFLTTGWHNAPRVIVHWHVACVVPCLIPACVHVGGAHQGDTHISKCN